MNSNVRHVDVEVKPLVVRSKPLPPSPGAAPTYILDRQNKALRDEAKLLRAEISHMKRVLYSYKQTLQEYDEYMTNSCLRLKQLQDTTFQLKRAKRRIQREWEDYLKSEGAVQENNIL
jgi:hypothetical protein